MFMVIIAILKKEVKPQVKQEGIESATATAVTIEQINIQNLHITYKPVTDVVGVKKHRANQIEKENADFKNDNSIFTFNKDENLTSDAIELLTDTQKSKEKLGPYKPLFDRLNKKFNTIFLSVWRRVQHENSIDSLDWEKDREKIMGLAEKNAIDLERSEREHGSRYRRLYNIVRSGDFLIWGTKELSKIESGEGKEEKISEKFNSMLGQRLKKHPNRIFINENLEQYEVLLSHIREKERLFWVHAKGSSGITTTLENLNRYCKEKGAKILDDQSNKIAKIPEHVFKVKKK